MPITHGHLLLNKPVGGIYLDHQATDRPRPQAIDAVVTFMKEDHFGNVSAHANIRGQQARRHLEYFRKVTASILGGAEETLLFTSGATESNNLVLWSEGQRKGAHLVVSAIEHKCVLESASKARKWGAKVSILPVSSQGIVDLEILKKLIDEGATFVSVMTANNEIGAIQPIHAISDLCQKSGVRLHTDAAQAIGKTTLNLGTASIDYLTFSAHKFGRPQGIGGFCAAPAW